MIRKHLKTAVMTVVLPSTESGPGFGSTSPQVTAKLKTEKNRLRQNKMFLYDLVVLVQVEKSCAFIPVESAGSKSTVKETFVTPLISRFQLVP